MSLSREEIIRMAREAGVYSGANEFVFAASLESLANAAYAAGAAAERELLEALERMVVILEPAERDFTPGEQIAMDDARAAIDKARGNGGEK